MFDNYENFGELLEGENTEWNEYSEFSEGESWDSSEARPRPRFSRVQTAKSGNPVPRAAASGYATKAELHATAQRLDARIATNSKALSALDGRTRAIGGDVSKLRHEFRKEVAERKATTDALKKGLDESRQLAMLLPLLTTQSSTTLKTAAGDTFNNVVIDDGDQMSRMLPILLLSGGMGSSGTGGSGSSGGLFGGDNSIAMLAMVSVLSGNKK